MKLKQAVQIAGERGCKFIAVDETGLIFAYMSCPIIVKNEWVDEHLTFIQLSHELYSGGKNWEDTLRLVR